MPKEKSGIAPFKWKDKSSGFKESKLILSLLRSMIRTNLWIMKEKEIHGSFAAIPQAAKVMATVFGKCLVKTEKALN